VVNISTFKLPLLANNRAIVNLRQDGLYNSS
jgi:hypothetical protein